MNRALIAGFSLGIISVLLLLQPEPYSQRRRRVLKRMTANCHEQLVRLTAFSGWEQDMGEWLSASFTAAVEREWDARLLG